MPNSNSTFSVVILCYNHEKFIKECIESILNQDTDEYFDIVIADDASTDRSVEVIESIIENHPWRSRITFIKNETNLGIADNCWNAIQYAKGEYLIGCGGDDVSRPDRVRELIALQRKYPEARAFQSAYTSMQEGGEHKALPDGEGDTFYPYKPKQRFGSIPMISGCSAMWHKETICSFGSFSMAGAEDSVFYYRTYLKRHGFAISSKRLVYYRIHSSNLCNFNSNSLHDQLNKIAYADIKTQAQFLKDLILVYTQSDSDYSPLEFESNARQLNKNLSRICLFPDAQCGNNFLLKWRWYISATSCFPRNVIKFAVRLLPAPIVQFYLNHIKRY